MVDLSREGPVMSNSDTILDSTVPLFCLELCCLLGIPSHFCSSRSLLTTILLWSMNLTTLDNSYREFIEHLSFALLCQEMVMMSMETQLILLYGCSKAFSPQGLNHSSSGCHPLSMWSGENAKWVAAGKGIKTSSVTSGGGSVGAEADGYSSLQSPVPCWITKIVSQVMVHPGSSVWTKMTPSRTTE